MNQIEVIPNGTNGHAPVAEVQAMPTTLAELEAIVERGLSTYVEVGVNANRLVGLAVPAEPTSSYLTTRDPQGTMTADLRSVDAFADGAVDPVDVTRAFSVGLGDARVVSQEREVHGEGDPGTLGPRVRALVVDSVVQLTRP